MVWKLLSLAAALYAVALLFSHMESKEDLIEIPRELLKDDLDDGLGPVPVLPQEYTLTFTPVISGDSDPPFGPFYDDDVRPPYNDFTFQALWESGDPPKQSAVETAHEWILRRQKEIFQTIFLLKYTEPKYRAVVELVRIEAAVMEPQSEDGAKKSYNSTMRIVVRETTAGSAHARDIRETLRDNVQSGGDTYECNDWGDVKDPNTGRMIRVSFSQFPVDWDPPLPKKQCKKQPPQNFNSYRPYTFH